MKKIRPATMIDIPPMREIYRPYIEESAISFELEVPTLEEFQRRLAERAGKFPWLVCELNNKIAGYAYASSFRDRPAYSWTVESTVYVQQGLHGQGIGKELYQCLLQMLKEQGAVNIIGGITLPNDASVALHERLGFVNATKIKDAGFKFGRWWDVGFWQLQYEKPSEAKALRAPGAARQKAP